MKEWYPQCAQEKKRADTVVYPAKHFYEFRPKKDILSAYYSDLHEIHVNSILKKYNSAIYK